MSNMSAETPLSIMGFDVDGTLVPRNRQEIRPAGLTNLLNNVSDLGHHSVLVTGKPVEYASQIYSTNGLVDKGIVGENAGVFRRPGSDLVEVHGPSLEELKALREIIGIGMDKVNVTKIILKGTEYEVVVDPGDKSILTIFTDPSNVTHRWNFNQSIDAEDLVGKLDNTIKTNGLDRNLAVLEPFPDGAVQVIRKDPTTGKPVDKSSLIATLRAMYPEMDDDINIAMFGDGHNDIPAMTPRKIIPVSFSNAHPDVKRFVSEKGGHLSTHDAPEGLGVIDGLLHLAERMFFGNDSKSIKDLILQAFPSLQRT